MNLFNSMASAVLCVLLLSALAPSRVSAQTWDIRTKHSVRGVTVYDTTELLTYAGQLAHNRTGRITKLARQGSEQ